jgi:hypothetical protein
MKKHQFGISIALVMLLAGMSNSDETKNKHLSCTFGGSFTDGVETHIDSNDDGISANLHQGLQDCNIGRFFLHSENEFQAALPAPVTCPAGTQEFDLVQAHGVLTAEKTSDQLFYEDAAGGFKFCLNSDLTFTFTEHGTWAGGTGQFTGASGSFDAQGSGKFLVTGTKAGVFGGFGQFTNTATGTLIESK